MSGLLGSILGLERSLLGKGLIIIFLIFKGHSKPHFLYVKFNNHTKLSYSRVLRGVDSILFLAFGAKVRSAAGEFGFLDFSVAFFAGLASPTVNF